MVSGSRSVIYLSHFPRMHNQALKGNSLVRGLATAPWSKSRSVRNYLIGAFVLPNMRLSGRAVYKVPVELLRRAAQLWR